MTNVVPLHSIRSPIGHGIRTGETSYRQIETLHAEGRLPVRTIIIDASRARRQKEFIRVLKGAGVEVILDTKCAELSEIGRYQGLAKGAPWAISEHPLSADDFNVGANAGIFAQIARLAVELDVDAVISPSHFLRNGILDDWFDIDCKAVEFLRLSLDMEGGRHIGIDHGLILPHTRLYEPNEQIVMLDRLSDLPYDNLILRLSGFGANAGAMTIKKTFQAIEALHHLNKPIILDHVSRLVGLSALAFGYADSIWHGIGEKEQFSAGDWHKPKVDIEPGTMRGRATYIPVSGIDKAFNKKTLDLISSKPRGKRLIACDDKKCCPHGFNSMKENPRAHIAYQSTQAILELARVPNQKRAEHFLDVDLRNVERKARDLAGVQTGDTKVDEKLQKAGRRIGSLGRMFETLIDALPEQRSTLIVQRINQKEDARS